VRIGFSWPLGRGRRMWISGNPLTLLLTFYIILAAYIVVGVAWVIVVLVQLLFYYGPRALYRAVAGRKQ